MITQDEAIQMADEAGTVFHMLLSEWEELKRENEELRKTAELTTAYSTELVVIIDRQAHELAALKSQSTEPVAWLFQHVETGRKMCVEVEQVELGFEKKNPRLEKICPLFTTPPTAIALVEDFRERAVIVCEAHASHWKTFGSSFYSSVAEHLKKKIESLPLIKGEK